MPLLIANVNPTSDTFQSWVDKTNQIASGLSTIVLTSAANTIGGQNSANAYLNGIFSANTIAAVESLRGGTVSQAANLTISSNAVFTGANVSTAVTYLNLLSTTTVINATSTTISGTSLAVTSNVNVKSNSLTITTPGRVGVNTALADAALTVSGSANVSANMYVGGVSTFAGNSTFNGIPTISQGNAVTTGFLGFGNTGFRSLGYDGSAYIFANTANVSLGGTLLCANVVTVANAGIDGVNVAAFKQTYDTRNILKVYDVNNTLLFTM